MAPESREKLRGGHPHASLYSCGLTEGLPKRMRCSLLRRFRLTLRIPVSEDTCACKHGAPLVPRVEIAIHEHPQDNRYGMSRENPARMSHFGWLWPFR